MGFANNRSIAWGIAKGYGRGRRAELAFTYQGEALEKRVRLWRANSAATWSASAT